MDKEIEGEEGRDVKRPRMESDLFQASPILTTKGTILV